MDVSPCAHQMGERLLTIAQSFEQDHDRLDALWLKFQALKPQEFQQAAACFAEFQTGLLQHIAWEEEILFPAFEMKTGLQGTGPTEVMRQEHRQIQQLLWTIAQALERRDPSSQAEETELRELLASHNMKEEHILYPAIDQQLTDDERREIFLRMEQKRTGADDSREASVRGPDLC